MPSTGGSHINMALLFGALVAGAVIIDYGVKSAKGALNSSAAAPGSDTGAQTPTSSGGFPKSVNPVPGAAVSRLDQGIDATAKTFVSPWAGKVVYATANDPGWKGGGYVAVQSTENPNFVYYLAEGITNVVKVGDMVTAGQTIAYPVANPYNGIVGNVEFGRANPASPGQPLAQVTSNAKQMVLDFSSWFQSLGGAAPTSTSNAGSS